MATQETIDGIICHHHRHSSVRSVWRVKGVSSDIDHHKLGNLVIVLRNIRLK